MKLKQKPAVMIAPTATGLYGLYSLIWAEGAGRIFGAIVVAFSIAFWVMAFAIDPNKPKNPPKALALLAIVLLAVTTLTACEGIPASPTPRAIDRGIVVYDNPPFKNEPNLGILRYWFNYTHSPTLPLVDVSASADAETVKTTDTAGLLSESNTTGSIPTNVIMARAAWFDDAKCAAGILVTGGFVVFTVANPPVGLGATIIAWGGNLFSSVTTLDQCWNTFGTVQVDGGPRWFLHCNNAYLTANDWNMLDPGWVHSDVVKFQECLVYGWAASRAAQLGALLDNNGFATLNGIYICTQEIFMRCYWT